jgi:hypothetical protein
LIASGVRVALGAPCFFDSTGDGDFSGELSGEAVGEGVSEGDVDLAGVSLGSGEGDDFFFGRGVGVGVGEGEAFFFLGAGVADSDSSFAVELFFFLEDGVTVGFGVSSSFAATDFFFGEGLGVGVDDIFFVPVECFFFRGVGVGVGPEKIFLIASPSDCSAAPAGAINEISNANTINERINMEEALTDGVAIS